MLSYRALQITPSATMAITALAREMKKNGIDVISFSAGEPDFDTPKHIKEAAIKAIDDGFTKYTPTSGNLELRQAICDKLKRDNNLDYQPKNILVSTGAKQCLYNIIQVLIDPGDEILLPIPSWVSYEEMTKIAGGKCIHVKSPDFKINAKLLDRHLSKKTKLLILCSPANPTGVVYEKEELQEIADFCVKNNIYVISDEIYEKLIYDKTHYSIAAFNEKIKKLTITVNGFSKSYAMTGWRIGYCAAEEGITKAASSLQDHSTSGPNSITQKAALTALNSSQDFLKDWVKEYKIRRDYMLQRLNKIKDLKPIKPDGAFYVFVDISNLEIDKSKDITKKVKDMNFFEKSSRDNTRVDDKLFRITTKKNAYPNLPINSIDFCQRLLEIAHVAAIPGHAFGDDNFIRLSFATSMENIKKGMDRFESITHNS